MKESVSIKKNDDTNDVFDLFKLKEEGLKKIQLLSGNNWTDYNSHDPGITILETLCYALTDLAYRADFDISTLLSTTGKTKIENSLFPAHEILTTSPLSIFDFKKMFLDIEGVKNCDFTPAYSDKVIPGVFDINIEAHQDFDDETSRENINKQLQNIINNNCPLGIVFDRIVFLEYDFIGVVLDIELADEVDPKKIFAKFIQDVQNYFSSEIKFKSLNELLDQDFGTETIFNGPLLKNGFLLDEQLSNQTIRKRIYLSDLITIAMAIDGVSFVRDLKIIDAEKKEYNWIYDVQFAKSPRIDSELSKFKCFYRNSLIFESKPSFIDLWASPKLNQTSSHSQNILDLPVGFSKNLLKYHSIQYDFPDTFGIGFKGPTAGATAIKSSAAKQLKGYLIIYDQIMANFLAQLDHVKYLFSTENIENTSAIQLIDDIPGVEYLYKYFIENYYIKHNDFSDKIKLKSEWNKYLKDQKHQLNREIQNSFETRVEFLKRRNSVLDHLLARFGVNTNKLELLSEMNQIEAINYKIDLLRNFPGLSSEKYSIGKSSVYPEISGLKAWLGKNLNLKGIKNEYITMGVSKFGFDNEIEAEIYSFENPLNELLKNGIDIENIVETGSNEVSIFDKDNEIVSRLHVVNKRQNELRTFIHQKIKEINHNSENFLVIDHISLKPTSDYLCYGFNILFDGKPIFISERKFSLNHCDLFVEKFKELSVRLDNFKVIETAFKEFRVSFECQYGNLLSRTYYSSYSEAINKFEYYLNSINSKLLTFSFSTKYENCYVNISNPFSYIISIILPTWATKFQNKGFKAYLEEYLYQELPAHLVVNIRWLDFDDMTTFEAVYNDYKSIATSNSVETKTNALDKLMSVLIS